MSHLTEFPIWLWYGVLTEVVYILTFLLEPTPLTTGQRDMGVSGEGRTRHGKEVVY